MKNQLVLREKKQTKFKTVKDISRVPSDLAKLQNYIDEAVKHKNKIRDEQADIKTLRQSAIDQLNIEPKMFNLLVNLAFNNNFEAKKQEVWNIEEAIDAITGGTLPSIPADKDD